MLIKALITVLAGGFTAVIILQNLISIPMNLFGRDYSVPLVVVIGWFLLMGFLSGLIWRNLPHYHRGKNQVPLIRADMKVCR